MPSRWWVPVPNVDPTSVRLEHVHAAVRRWFDDTAAEHDSASKPYAIAPLSEWPGSPEVGFELGALTDEIAERLHVACNSARELRLGRQFLRVGVPRHLDSESWSDLATYSGARRWALDFNTPTTFRRGDRSTPLPAPASILRRQIDTWNAWSGYPSRSLDQQQHDAIWLSDLSGQSELLTVSGIRLSGFVGRIELRCDDPATVELIDGPLRLGTYSGIGSAKAKGLGVTVV